MGWPAPSSGGPAFFSLKWYCYIYECVGASKCNMCDAVRGFNCLHQGLICLCVGCRYCRFWHWAVVAVWAFERGDINFYYFVQLFSSLHNLVWFHQNQTFWLTIASNAQVSIFHRGNRWYYCSTLNVKAAAGKNLHLFAQYVVFLPTNILLLALQEKVIFFSHISSPNTQLFSARKYW